MKALGFFVVSVLSVGALCAQVAPSAQDSESPARQRQRPQRGERGDRASRPERAPRGEGFAGRGDRQARGGATLFDSGSTSVASGPSSSSYEVRGFFGVGDELEVSIRPAGTEASRWIRVGKKSGDWFLESADSSRGIAVLVVDGRKHTVRLAKEAQVRDAPGATQLVQPAPEPEAPRTRTNAERMQEMRANMTPEQGAAFGRVMQSRMQELVRDNPSLMSRPTDAAEARGRRELMYGVLREAAEETAKLPNKQGVVAPLPDDHEQLLREELVRMIPDPTESAAP